MMRLFISINYLVFFICLLSASMVAQEQLEGPLDVCENECYEYYYDGENGGPFLWTAVGGVIEDNKGSVVKICWEEVQPASIQILNASISLTLPVLDEVVTISATPETDIIFPLYPLCETRTDSMEQPNGEEFPEIVNCKTVCPGSVVSYFSTNESDFQRQWIVEGHQNIDDENMANDSLGNGTVHWNEEGYGSILLIEESEAGCVDSSFYCIEILDKPEVELTVLNDGIDLQNLCKDQTIYLQGSADEALSYEWQTSDGQSFAGADARLSFSQSGEYIISLFTTTACYCIDSLSLSVTVIDDVVPVIDCVGTTCMGEEQTYYAMDICGSYSWMVSPQGTITDGGASSDNFITVIWNDGPLGVVSLMTAACEESNICTGVTEVVIPIMGSSLEIQGPAIVCKTSTTSYSVPYFSGANYNWTISDNGYIIDGWGTNSISVSWNAGEDSNDNSTIDVFIDNCFLECSSSSSKTIDLKDKFHISTSEKACEGDNGYLVAVVGYFEVAVDWIMVAPDGTETELATANEFFNISYDQGPGRYEFIAIENSGAYCNAEDKVSIEVFPTPEVPAEIVGAQYICVGQNYLYKLEEFNDNYEYYWTIRDGNDTQRLGGSEVLVSWMSSGPYEVSVRVKDVDTQCESENQNLEVLEAAGGSLLGKVLSCLDQRANYEITGVLPHNIDWKVAPSSAGTIAILNEGEIAVHWHESGTHKISANYCSIVYELEVDILAAPSVDVLAPDAVCVGEKAEVNFVGPIGSTYIVFDENERIVSETTTEPALIAAGYYGVEVIDANGCTARVPFYIDSFEKPAINVSSIGWHQLCSPGGTAYLESVAMTDGLSYQWYKDGVPFGTDSPKLLADEEASYRLVVTNSNGCTAEETKYLECSQGGCDCRPDGGTKFTTTKTAFCNVYDFQNASFDFIPGTLSYNFGDPDSGSDNYSTDENPSHTFSQAGHYVVTFSGQVNSTNIPGETCLARYQSYVTVEAAADFDHVSACANEDISFEELSNFLVDYSVVAYEWDFGDSSSGLSNVSNLEEPTHVFTSPGFYQVALTITTDSGCQAVYAKEIEIYGTPEIDFNLPFSKCIDEGLEFFVSSPAMFDLEWSFGDPSSGAANSSSNLSPIHSFLTAGTYTIELTGTSIHGCIDKISKTITVSENTLTGEITIDKTMPMCLGDVAILTAPSGGIAYLWSTGETTDNILATESDIYSVTVTGSNVCDYVPDAVIVNTIKPISPTIRAYTEGAFNSITGSLALCQGEIFSLRGSYHFNATYLWSTGQTSLSIEYNELSLLAPGEHIIELEVRDSDTGCIISAEPFELTIYSRPAAFMINSNQSDNCEGPEFIFSVDNPDPELRYFWSNGMTGTEISVTKPDYYFATVVSPYGCTNYSNGIRINPLPNTSNFLTGCQEVCFPKTLCISQDNTLTSWQWMLDGVAIPGPVGTAATLEATGVGEYQAILYSVFGCSATTGILSLTPETKEQSLSGVVYLDEDGDGVFSLGETPLSGIKVRVLSGNTLIQETITDLVGKYILDPLEISEAVIAIDTVGIGFEVDAIETKYSFELLDCTEDLIQDFPLTKTCKKSSEEVTLFVCLEELISYNGQQYSVSEKDTLYNINAEGCDSLVYLAVEAYPAAFAQAVTYGTCAGETDGSVELVGASSTDLEYSLDGSSFTTSVNFSGLAEGAHSVILKDIYSCETAVDFSIEAFVVPAVMLAVSVDCDNRGTLVIDNMGNEDLMYEIDGMGTLYSSTEIANLIPGPHLLVVHDKNGCTSQENFVIDSYVTPTVDFTVEASCFDANSGGLVIEPSSSQNLSFGIDSPSSLSTELSFSDLSVGNHILYVEDLAGCSYEFPFIIDPVPMPVFDLVTTRSCAAATSGVLDISTMESGLTFSFDEINFSPDVGYVNLGAGSQSLFIKTADGCILEEVFEIETYAESMVEVQTEQSCYNSGTGSIELASQNPLLEFSIDGSPFGAASTFEDLPAGNYELRVKDEHACEQQVIVVVEELTELQVNFPEETASCLTTATNLKADVVQGEMLLYLWSDGSTNESLLVTETGSYTIEVSDACSMTSYTWDILFDEVSTDIYLPTIFTPEEQSLNGAFGVQFSEDLKVTKFDLSVMDKWGNEIYGTNNYLEAWDGRVNNTSINPGVFMWTYTAEYEVCKEFTEVQKVGSVTIIK